MFASTKRGWAAACAAAIAGGLLVSSPALADVESIYISPVEYVYEFRHVPDFDQRRAGLPNDGNAYCVPTAATNWMAYFANHGAPWIHPGPGWWQSNGRYDDATSAIDLMGLLMGTDPFDGTTGRPAQFALQVWLSEAPFLVVRHYSTRSWSPGFHDISSHVFMGGHVMVGVGWYENVGEGRIHRNGGHELTLTYGRREEQNLLIGWHDPGSNDGDLNRQGRFTTEIYGVVHEFRLPTWTNAFPRFMSRPVGYGNAYIDEIMAIHPLFALSSQPDPTTLRFHVLPTLWGAVPDLGLEMESAERTTIRELLLHPDLVSLCYIADSADPDYPPKLWRVDRITGAEQELDLGLHHPWDVGTMHFGRRLDLYVVDGNDLVLCDIDRQPPEEEARVAPPSLVSAITYDEDSDEVVLLSVPQRELIYYPYRLDAAPVVHRIPDEVELGGRARIRWDPVRDCVWLVSEQSRLVTRLYVKMDELHAVEYGHQTLSWPCDDVDVDDAGRLYLSWRGVIREFEVDEDEPLLIIPDDLYFVGAPAGAVLRVARSATNFDPDVHALPEWNNVLPTEVGDPIADCPADLDGNRLVEVTDLLMLLGAWGSCPPDRFCHADLDYNTAVEVADLLIILREWGVCP